MEIEDETESNHCEYCGCNGKHDTSDLCKAYKRIWIFVWLLYLCYCTPLDFAVTRLTESIKTFQQENVVMFSRIMAKINGEDSSCLDTADIGIKDLPFRQAEKLLELNKLCGDQPKAKFFLVSSENRIYFAVF